MRHQRPTAGRRRPDGRHVRRRRRGRQAPVHPLRQRLLVAFAPADERFMDSRPGGGGARVAAADRAVDGDGTADRHRPPGARGDDDCARGPRRRTSRTRPVRGGSARPRRGGRADADGSRTCRWPPRCSINATSPVSATCTRSRFRSSPASPRTSRSDRSKGSKQLVGFGHSADPHQRRTWPAEHDRSPVDHRRSLDLRQARTTVPDLCHHPRRLRRTRVAVATGLGVVPECQRLDPCVRRAGAVQEVDGVASSPPPSRFPAHLA